MIPQLIDLHISLQWHEWVPWGEMLKDVRSDKSAPNPPAASGVYEVKFVIHDYRLIIGKASNLRKRLKDQLIKGYGHPPGERLKKEIDDRSDIHVRWALTDSPAAAEEFLLKQHMVMHDGDLPTYVRSI